MERTKQLTVCLPNTPGTLAKLCRCLADANVNILAISVVDAAEACLVRLVADDVRAAVKAIESNHMSVVQTPVRLIELPNKVGALAEMTERLSQRKVNVSFVYGSTGRPGTAILVLEARSQK